VQEEGSVTNWIDRLRGGDDVAADGLWRRYFDQLMRVARGRLHNQSRRVADEEDVAISAMNSFFQGIRQDRYPRLHDRDDLWQLLVLITARKAIDQFHHQRRQKRADHRLVERLPTADTGDGREHQALEDLVGREPSPEFALLVAEQCQRLLDRLGDSALATVAQLKLECWTNAEIAEQAGCSLRTVERRLELIRVKWSEGTHDNE
jgi:DNA-directed RNA polymerase specialized sigma24 family protein